MKITRHPEKFGYTLCYPWTHEHHRAEHEESPENQRQSGQVATTTPEYPVQAPGAPGDGRGQRLIAATPNPRAGLIMLEQWRAGLRVPEAPVLEARDLHLDSDCPTLVVRQGKGRKSRVVPVHLQLQTVLTEATSLGTVGQAG